MPYSAEESREWVKERYWSSNPITIVDVGPGSGTYSELLKTSDTIWVGIEAWAPYVEEFDLFNKYNHVVISDIRHCELDSVFVEPDMVIAGDVLEHLDKHEAVVVVNKLKRWAREIILVMPNGEYPQDEYEGNWFEVHRATWTHEEIEKELLSDGEILSSFKGEIVSGFHWRKFDENNSDDTVQE